MTIKTFTTILNALQKTQKRSFDLYQNYKIDLMDYEEDREVIINTLLKEIFNENQMDWIDWFCYENDFGEKSLEASDKDGNLICQNIEQLYKFIYE